MSNLVPAANQLPAEPKRSRKINKGGQTPTADQTALVIAQPADMTPARTDRVDLNTTPVMAKAEKNTAAEAYRIVVGGAEDLISLQNAGLAAGQYAANALIQQQNDRIALMNAESAERQQQTNEATQQRIDDVRARTERVRSFQYTPGHTFDEMMDAYEAARQG